VEARPAVLVELEALGPDIAAAAVQASFLTEETAVIMIDAPPRRAWIGVAIAATLIATLIATLVGVTVAGARGGRTDATASARHQVARADTGRRDPVAAAPPPAARVVPPASPATLVAPAAQPDLPEYDRHGRRVRRSSSRNRAARPTAPQSAPTTQPQATTPRRNSQPYGTFEGM